MKPQKSLLLLLMILLTLLSCSRPPIETITPKIGPIQGGFKEMARTRVATTYKLTMPFSAELNKITLKPGDQVKEGQILAVVKQYPLELAVKKAQAKLEELRNRLAAQKARKAALSTSQQYARKALKRDETLSKKAMLATATVDKAKVAARTSKLAVKEQRFNISALQAAYDQAKAQFKQAEYNLRASKIRAPISSVILNRYTQGNHWLTAGTPLLRIGNPHHLDIVSEVLTNDAQKLKVGDSVYLSHRGERYTMHGKIKSIYPEAFTKRSSLGIDEQRVTIIIQPDDYMEFKGKAGYRLYVKFITDSKTNALLIPRTSVLEDEQGNIYVFSIKDGHLQKQMITVDIITEKNISVIKGLTEKQRIVKNPTAKMHTGMHV